MTDRAQWRGNVLFLASKPTRIELVRDSVYPDMWRVRYPDGTLSDLANRARAAALAMLGTEGKAADSRADRGSVRQTPQTGTESAPPE